MERAREQDADRVSVLHISPRANVKLRRVTSPELRRFGDDAFKLWPTLLREPSRFRGVAAEDLFGAFEVRDFPDLADWRAYVDGRYAFAAASA